MAEGPQSDSCPTMSLLERWRTGDDGAFALLWRRHMPLLRARVRSSDVWPLLQALLEPDDVLQETWARATHAMRTRFVDRGRGSLLAFLSAVTDDTLVSLARTATAKKRGRGLLRPLAAAIESATLSRSGRRTIETPTGRLRAAEMMELARDTLSERELAAWELTVLEDHTDEEVGVALRCSAAAARGLVHRAKGKLLLRLTTRNAGRPR